MPNPSASSTQDSPEPAGIDFRKRSAAKRREKTRAKLLDATMKACAERGASVIIEDVLRTAGVSRGTFYAHFNSLHDSVSIVAQQLADEATEVHAEMFSNVDDPVFRMGVGPQLIMMRAILEPAWGATIVQSDQFLTSSTFVAAIRKDVENGMRRGVFRRTDTESAVDLHLGAMMQGVKTLQKRRRGRLTYIRAVAGNLLMAFGVPLQTVEETLDKIAQDLNSRGPAYLTWWRPL